MGKYYLICIKCNGYYELKESPDDFRIIQNLQFDNESYECSNCGGELVLVDEIDDYFEDYEYNKRPRKNIRKSMLLLTFLLIIIPFVLFSNESDMANSNTQLAHTHSFLSSDYRGYIVKDVYSNIGFNSNTKTIAIVTGMHPREDLSKRVTGSIISKYRLKSGTQIVHYNVDVTNNPNVYSTGRNNGEGLVADYILPDILKNDIDLVIICHDHKLGYGDGYYVATPQMDENSVLLAEFLKQSINGFNYVRSDNIKESTSSAKKISKPLASAGYRTLVYEIPEWSSYNEAYSTTENVIGQCFNFI